MMRVKQDIFGVKKNFKKFPNTLARYLLYIVQQVLARFTLANNGV